MTFCLYELEYFQDKMWIGKILQNITSSCVNLMGNRPRGERAGRKKTGVENTRLRKDQLGKGTGLKRPNRENT